MLNRLTLFVPDLTDSEILCGIMDELAERVKVEVLVSRGIVLSFRSNWKILSQTRNSKWSYEDMPISRAVFVQVIKLDHAEKTFLL